MKRKNVLILALTICTVAILAVGASLAYFTAEKSASNVFTVGNVDIVLTEPNWNSSGSVDARTVYPGEPLAKDPTVKNSGQNPCFVRIKVTGLDQFVPDPEDIPEGWTADDYMITYRTNYNPGYDTANWEYCNGYFYYKYVLYPNTTEYSDPLLVKETSKLFHQIVIPKAIENGNGWSQFSVDVQAQAVQAQGARPSFAAVKLMTVSEIDAWFTTCGL